MTQLHDLLVELGLRRWALRTVDQRRAVLLLCDDRTGRRVIAGEVAG